MRKIFFLAALWLVPLCFAGDSDLLAWWPFDNDFRDAGPSRLHGRPLRGASFDAGRFGRALKLNGSSSFVSVPDHGELRFGKGNFTIALWIKFPITGKTNTFGLISKSGDETSLGWSLWADQKSLHYYESGGFEFEFAPFRDGWRHVVVIREKNVYRFYADGQLAAQKQVENIADLNAEGPLVFGRKEDIHFAATLLDEVQFYVQAIDQEEVTALFKGIPPEVAQKQMSAPIPAMEPVIAHQKPTSPSEAIANPSPPAFASEAATNLPLATVVEESPAPLARLNPVTVIHVTRSTDEDWITSEPALNPDGSLLLASSEAGRMVLLHLDEDGKKPILRASGQGESGATAVASSRNGRLGVTGFHNQKTILGRSTLDNKGESDIFVASLDASGALLWVVSAGGPGMDQGEDLAFDAAGNLYVTGSFSEGARFMEQPTHGGSKNLFVACFEPTGRLLWLFEAGHVEGQISGNGIRVTADGTYIALSGHYHGKVMLGDTQLKGTGSFLAGLHIEK